MDAIGFASECKLNSILFRQPCMVVQIGDQLLDDDAKAGGFIFAKPFDSSEVSRCSGSMVDRAASRELPAHAVGIRFARGHWNRYVTIP